MPDWLSVPFVGGPRDGEISGVRTGIGGKPPGSIPCKGGFYRLGLQASRPDYHFETDLEKETGRV